MRDPHFAHRGCEGLVAKDCPDFAALAFLGRPRFAGTLVGFFIRGFLVFNIGCPSFLKTSLVPAVTAIILQ